MPADGARSPRGYFRWPAVHGNHLVFVCEDDLHSADVRAGGVPRRLTDTPGPARAPVFSPDGTHIAFTVAEDECEEVYVVSAEGGAAMKVTGAGAEYARVACWSPDGDSLVFASSASAQFVDAQELWTVQLVYDDDACGDGYGDACDDDDATAAGTSRRESRSARSIVGASEPSRLRLGPANAASFRPGGRGRMLGRDARDPATRHWKGYKGGARGELWLDLNGDGAFRRVAFEGDDPASSLSACFNVGDAAWASRDVVVVAADDGSGRANLWSFRIPPDADAADAARAEDAPIAVTLVKHTSRRDFCVRHPALDAAAVRRGDDAVTAVYASGGRLFASELDVSRTTTGASSETDDAIVAGREIAIEWRGAEAQCERFRLESPDEHVDDVTLHPEGLTVVATARGRAFAMGLWDGPAIELEPPAPDRSYARHRDADLASSAPPGSDVLFDIASGGSVARRDGTPSSGGGKKKTARRGAPRDAFETARAGYAPRARLCAYLWDATRIAVVRDARGEDDIEIHWEDGSRDAVFLNLPPAVLGRPVAVTASPEAPLLAVVNHRAELLVVDCDTGNGSGFGTSSETSRPAVPVVRLADASPESGGIRHVAWSPCGCWLAYTWHETAEVSKVRVLDVRAGVARDATEPILNDSSPAWDPAGDYLYFLSSRELEPAYDAARFGLSFHGSERPHCVALRADVRNPLLRELRPPHDGGSSSDEDDASESESESESEAESSSADAPPPIEIEFDGLFDRVVALPVPSGRYAHVLGLDDGKFCVVKFPGRRPGRIGLDAPYYAGDDSDDGSEDDEDGAGGRGGALLKFDVTRLESSVLVEEGVKRATLSMDRRCVLLRCSSASPGYADEYRCYKAGAKPEDEDSDGEEVDFDAHNRRSGLIDLETRLDQIVVRPRAEWTQMLCEAWRVLRDEWWDESMAPGDAALGAGGGATTARATHAARWTERLKRYVRDVLPRAAARSEVNDVFAELGAELRSSHVAIAVGDAAGETRRRANATPGRLGCDAVWDAKHGGYRVTRLVKGDAWDALAGGALVKPGVNCAVGDVVLKINGRRLTETRGVSDALVGCGGKEVSLTFLVSPERDDARARDATRGMRDLRVSDDSAPRASRVGLGPKRRSSASRRDERSRATRTETSRAASAPRTHPGFTPNPAAAKPNAARVPGTVVTVRVRAMHSELDARYRDLIAERHARVETVSGGAVGYLHVPDMERFGYGEFWRRFPRESRKGALIVDLRGNCGGHISELILAKLAQRPLAFDVPRRGAPTAYPSHAAGFVVTLVDQDTGSDAELAAHAFRNAGLGPIVGTRTWGGLLTVAGGARLVDGGYVSFPSQNVVAFEEGVARRDADPGNAVENHGVVPDVEAATSPSEHRRGEDPQLDAATRAALRLLARAGSETGSESSASASARGESLEGLGSFAAAHARDERGRGTDARPRAAAAARADVARRDAALAAAARLDGSGWKKKTAAGGSASASPSPSWSFRVFAPYPEPCDSESSAPESDGDACETESDEDGRARRSRGKPKGASRRR